MPAHKFQYKICVVGNEDVGKSSMIYRQLYNKFIVPKPLPTIGNQFPILEYELGDSDKPYIVKITIWVYEPFTLRWAFGKRASCVILVFDSNDPNSLLDLDTSIETTREYIGEKGPFVLVGSKCDLPCKVDDSEVQKISRKLKAPLFWTSAKTGSGLDDVFRTAALLAHEFALERGALLEVKQKEESTEVK